MPLPKCFFVSENAEKTASLSVMSATKVRTVVPGYWVSIEVLVMEREEEVLPRMVIAVLPDAAKDRAMRDPMP